MIEQLFGNISRRKVLEFFLMRIHNSFSFEEIKNNLSDSLSASALKKEINALVELGIIDAYWHNFFETSEEIEGDKSKKTARAPKKEKARKEILFRVNASFPLLPELRSLVLKSIIFWEKKIVKKIKSLGSLNFLAFTGFFTDINSAPTDIIIVGRINKKQLARVMKRFQSEIHCPVRYTLFSRKEFDYRMDITDRFLYDILESKKITVVDEILKHEA